MKRYFPGHFKEELKGILGKKRYLLIVRTWFDQITKMGHHKMSITKDIC